MKQPHPTLFSVVLGLAAVGTAQGAVVLSNLGQSSPGFDYVTGPGSAEVMHATLFTTGNSAGGYQLESVSLGIRFSASDTVANGFVRVDLYSSNRTTPNNLLSTLSGSSNPSTTGTYQYTATGVNLSPGTSYWVVARVTSGDSTYLWNYAQDNTLTVNATGWSMNGTYADYRPGDGWVTDTGTPSLLAISASPVPEPAEYAAVSALGLVGAAWLRRRRASR